MTRSTLFVLAAFGLTLLAACHAGVNDPGRAYAPDMYYSQAYEPYSPNEAMASGMSAILPAENTVAYGYGIGNGPDLPPWPFPNVGDADTFRIMPAMRAYENPVPVTPEGLASGKENYRIYCGICHGPELNGKGYLVTGTKYGQAPANLMEDRLMSGASDGWYYHVLEYGKNAMGAYAYAMTREQRWDVINYIRARQETYVAERDAEAAAAEASAATETETTEGNTSSDEIAAAN